MLRSVRKGGGATSAEVQIDTGRRRGAVLRWLNLLIDSGEVRAIGPARSKLRRDELGADSVDANR